MKGTNTNKLSGKSLTKEKIRILLNTVKPHHIPELLKSLGSIEPAEPRPAVHRCHRSNFNWQFSVDP